MLHFQLQLIITEDPNQLLGHLAIQYLPGLAIGFMIMIPAWIAVRLSGRTALAQKLQNEGIVWNIAYLGGGAMYFGFVYTLSQLCFHQTHPFVWFVGLLAPIWDRLALSAYITPKKALIASLPFIVRGYRFGILKTEKFLNAISAWLSQAVIHLGKNAEQNQKKYSVETKPVEERKRIAFRKKTRSALNEAIPVFVGYGSSETPNENVDRLQELFGPMAHDLEMEIRAQLADLEKIIPDWEQHTLESGKEWAVARLREKHVEIDDEAGVALCWYFSHLWEEV